ncbi:MAG: arabinose-5-phosphate isomerase [Desulfobacteraceae bacterium 4484_190.1]|nr:MAG: arabinose-5-phosphate isomerase [Desulfobacteraceae bacterium 4484_190.1]
MKSIEEAKKVLDIEAQSILALKERVGEQFKEAVDTIMASKGRVILTGMGKSGLIGRKIAATLNSTGTPALFLHPGEAIHGDLGMVTSKDVVLAISNGGHTAEINRILPILKEMGAIIISFTGRMDSPMAMASDIVIDVGVEREACPMGLAPTASTTAALAMGDALAVALIHCRHFSKQDFKRIHPGGSLGERLSAKVSDVMLTGHQIPMVYVNSLVKDAVTEINAKKIGATLVQTENGNLAGIICDGDLRRGLIVHKDILNMQVNEIMTPSPKTIDSEQKAADALALMELHGITHLPVVDEKYSIKGILHLHDLLGREQFRLNDE